MGWTREQAEYVATEQNRQIAALSDGRRGYLVAKFHSREYGWIAEGSFIVESHGACMGETTGKYWGEGPPKVPEAT